MLAYKKRNLLRGPARRWIALPVLAALTLVGTLMLGSFRAAASTDSRATTLTSDLGDGRVIPSSPAGDPRNSLDLRLGLELPDPPADGDMDQDPDSDDDGDGATAEPEASQTYLVRPGDTLLGIAYRLGVDMNAIARANGLVAPYFLRDGRVLLIPATAEPQSSEGSRQAVSARGGYRNDRESSGSTTYQVRPGDTLLGIASRLDVDMDAIARANGLVAPYFLREGRGLLIPATGGQQGGGDIAAATTAAATGADDARHVVRSGDTVLGLAYRLGVSADAIIAANGLTPPYFLSVGRALIIPEAAEDEPAPATWRLEEDSFGARIVELALRYRGYRYRWGGVSPGTGFDCSGLVYYVYQQAGRPIPRDLFGQLAAGPRIGRNDVEPGDIVFFANTYTPGLSHDGIYIGDGRFISAVDEYSGVAISDFNDSYWRPRFYGASRPR